LIKDDLLTTLYTYDEQIFVNFYTHLAKYCILKNFERHFKVSKKLGEGTFSVVYEGKSIFSNSEVALKVFDKKKLF
jgi:serine/threonine protein kinase